MGIQAASNTSISLPIGGLWTIEVYTTDNDGYLVDNAPSIVVTIPAGSTTTPTFETVSTGIYRATYTVGTAGRYIARVTITGDAVDFTAYASPTTAGTAMPTSADVSAYLGANNTSFTNSDIQDALDAEAAAQRAVCRIGAVYSADLRQALLRRVQRNLALRRLPLIVPSGDADAMTPSAMPTNDPEVRRLERPYRKLVVG